MCGWTQGISYYGDDQNTEFNALQVTLAQSYYKGLATTFNYQWASAFDDQTGYWTWSHSIPHQRDSNVRAQQLTVYGSYDLPFGKGKQFAHNVNHATDLLIGGFQLSYSVELGGRSAVRHRLQQLRRVSRAGRRELQPQRWRHSSTLPSECQSGT